MKSVLDLFRFLTYFELLRLRLVFSSGHVSADMAADDYRSRVVPAKSIYFAPSSVTSAVTLTTTPRYVSRPIYHSGEYSARFLRRFLS